MTLQLTPIEARVLGSLIEKAHTTPDLYPLSLNALVNACNQKSSRDPLMNLDETTVVRAIATLKEKKSCRAEKRVRQSRPEISSPC